MVSMCNTTELAASFGEAASLAASRGDDVHKAVEAERSSFSCTRFESLSISRVFLASIFGGWA